MLGLHAHPEGVVIAIRVQPGAKRSGIVGFHGDALKVAVTAPPEGGRANQALLDVLRRQLELKRSQVELISGQTSRDKRALIRGLSRLQVSDLLEKLFESR